LNAYLDTLFSSSKYCPAGCVIPFADISGTIPHGYRDVSKNTVDSSEFC